MEDSVKDGEIFIKIASKGSKEDGEEWDDGPAGQVKQICIWHGNLIYGIQVTYQAHQTNVLSRRHGGTDGDFETIYFKEPLTFVSGHYGSWCMEPEIFADEEEGPYNYCTVIRSLTFGTSRATYGPFGKETGTPFSFKMSTGCSGFHGRAGSNEYGMLHAIGVHIRSMAEQLVDAAAVPPPPPTPVYSPPLLAEETKAVPKLEGGSGTKSV